MTLHACFQDEKWEKKNVTLAIVFLYAVQSIIVNAYRANVIFHFHFCSITLYRESLLFNIKTLWKEIYFGILFCYISQLYLPLKFYNFMKFQDI